MGTAIYGDHVYAASSSKVYKLTKDFKTVATSDRFRDHLFHQLNVYDHKVYLTVTKLNRIWVLDASLKVIDKHLINPPLPGYPMAKENYNHINNIVKHYDKWWVGLNWLTEEQYGASGVAMLDEDFTELKRFEYGWESHEFGFLEDQMICVCATSNKNINHPARSGVMLNFEMVFEHDPEEAFCKGLTWDDNYFYLGGGEKRDLGDRRNGGGILYVVDRKDYRLVAKLQNENCKNIKSVLLWK